MAFVPPTFNVPPAAPPASDPPAPDAATEPAGPAPEDQAAAEPEQTARVKVGDLVQHSYVDEYDERTDHVLVGHVVDVTDGDEAVATVAWSTGGRAALPVDQLEVL